jgi:hypothetical protein
MGAIPVKVIPVRRLNQHQKMPLKTLNILGDSNRIILKNGSIVLQGISIFSKISLPKGLLFWQYRD